MLTSSSNSDKDADGIRHADIAHDLFRTLFESAPGAYLVLKPGDYEIVAVSDAYLHATMTRREGILKRRLFDVFPDAPNEPWSSGVRNLRASLERVKATGLTDVMAVQRYPIRRPEEEGGGFEERWWSPVNAPVFGPDKELAYIIHRVEDVTSYIRQERKEGEDRLTEQRKRLEAEIVQRGINLQNANEALRERESQLERANADLDDFATIVSHDLKAPLRAISTLAKWITTDYAEKLDEEGRGNLEEMVKRAAIMDKMIEDILEYSRVGRKKEDLETIPTEEVISQVIEGLAPPSDVHINVSSPLPAICGEPVRLRQLFQNLIENAIKYRDKPVTEINVLCKEAGSMWEFTIEDNGPGIEPQHFERIFKIFQTLTPKGRSGSTGVGLALVKRIVELAGGRVCVESRLKEGTAFHFTWPRMRESKEDSRTSAENEYAKAGNA